MAQNGAEAVTTNTADNASEIFPRFEGVAAIKAAPFVAVCVLPEAVDVDVVVPFVLVYTSVNTPPSSIATSRYSLGEDFDVLDLEVRIIIVSGRAHEVEAAS